MPYISINVSQKITDEQKTDIKTKLGSIIDVIPSKTEEVLMINIADDQKMFFRGKPLASGAFMQISLYKPAPHESKKEFVEKAFGIFKDVLSAEPKDVFITVNEYENWGANGTLI
jgi:phenylpyruvate tautomerase PptA (4-oxalocrotonate tautomerase family)